MPQIVAGPSEAVNNLSNAHRRVCLDKQVNVVGHNLSEVQNYAAFLGYCFQERLKASVNRRRQYGSRYLGHQTM